MNLQFKNQKFSLLHVIMNNYNTDMDSRPSRSIPHFYRSCCSIVQFADLKNIRNMVIIYRYGSCHLEMRSIHQYIFKETKNIINVINNRRIENKEFFSSLVGKTV